MKLSFFIGMDIGTTGIKAVVTDDSGKIIEIFSRQLDIESQKHGWMEQNPEKWFEKTVEILAEIHSKYETEAMSFSGQMHSLVIVDGDGDIIRNAILWCDQRTSTQCKYITDILGGEKEVILRIGNPILEGFTLPKIIWLMENEPENYLRIKKIMLPKDYIIYRLTGSWCTDHSDASGTACYGVDKRDWDYEMLERLNLKSEIFPEIKDAGTLVGKIDGKVAAKYGLPRIKIYMGGADNAVSAYGSGVVSEGDCMVSIGTSGTVLAVGESSPDLSGRIHYFNHVKRNTSYLMGVMLSAAHSLNWFKGKMGNDTEWIEIENEVGKRLGKNSGMLFLPYLNGERTPHRDPNAKGVLFGISSSSDEYDVFKAVMEGVVFGLRDSFELIKNRIKIKNVKVVGGGSKNTVWMKMLADNLKTILEIPEIDEGGAYGAALLAINGEGIRVSGYDSKSRKIEPDGQGEYYDHNYGKFREMYYKLRDLF